MSQKKFDISVNIVQEINNNEHYNNSLTLKIFGKDVNTMILSSITKTIMEYIPGYAFHPDNIKIINNSSAYINDIVRQFLSHIPLININIDIDYLHESFWFDIDYESLIREKHPNEKKIEMYIDKKNNTNENLNITSDDIEIAIDGELIATKKIFDKKKIMIITLRPYEDFKVEMKSSIGIGKINDIYSLHNSYIYYDDETMEDDDENLKRFLVIETRQSNYCKKLYKIACENIIIKLNIIKKKLHSYVVNENKFRFELMNESFIIGNIINERLQDNENIIFSGLIKFDHQSNQMAIEIIAKENYNPHEILISEISYLIDLYTYMSKLLKQ